MEDHPLDLCTEVSSPRTASRSRSKEWIAAGMFSGEFVLHESKCLSGDL